MSITCDPAALVKAAKCAPCVPKQSRRSVRSYLLCQLARTGVGKNLIPATAKYTGATPEFDLTVLAQTSYIITWGNNDLSMTLCGVNYPSTGAGTMTAVFTAACTLMQFFGTFAGTTVTARVIQNHSIIPVPTGFTWVPNAAGTQGVGTWDNPNFLLVTYAELWTSPDNVTYSLAATVNFPTATASVTGPAIGSTLWAKVRWCGPTTPCGPFSSALFINGVAADWVKRVAANGGADPSANTKKAVSNFVSALVTAGIDTKMLAVSMLVPDNLTAARTPLYKVLGTDPWANNGFVAGDLTVDGLIGNGTSKFLNMGFTATQLQAASVSNYAFFAYHFTGNNLFEISIGMQNGAVLYDLQTFTDSHTICDQSFAGGNGRITVLNAAWTGYLCGSRLSQTDQKLYKANSTTPHTQIGTNAVNVAPESVATNFYAFANDNAGVAGSWVTKRISCIGAAKGLTAQNSSDLFNAIDALRIALGGGRV